MESNKKLKIHRNTRGQRQSKLKRTKANARERYRMYKLNQAFDNLRQHLPLQQQCYTSMITFVASIDIYQGTQYHKLSKIDTLRLARNYIKVLNYILNNSNQIEYEKLFSILINDLNQSTINSLKIHSKLKNNFLQHLFKNNNSENLNNGKL